VLAMEARSVDSLPRGAEWQYEPKWDGFRCLLIRSGNRVRMQSKSGRDLARYFPEVVIVAKGIGETQFTLDGELVIPVGERFSFDDLLQRIHPAASRIKRLADEDTGSIPCVRSSSLWRERSGDAADHEKATGARTVRQTAFQERSRLPTFTSKPKLR
jgi:hypothetical protein